MVNRGAQEVKDDWCLSACGDDRGRFTVYGV